MLKLCAIISNHIKDLKDNNEMRETILKYSVAITYKITKFIKEDIFIKINEFKGISNELTKLNNVKCNLNDKMTLLMNSINEQNSLLKNNNKELEYNQDEFSSETNHYSEN